jgi:lipopolysaccharide export system protein LptA
VTFFYKCTFLVAGAFLFFLPIICAQNTAADTSTNRIIIDRFVAAELVQNNTEEVKKLSGDVMMHQGDAYMFCDTAYLYGENRLVAIGRVVIKHGDSVTVFGNRLLYDGQTRIAEMLGNEPILVNGRQQLFAEKQMIYNLATKIATYSNRALLDNGKTQLRSQAGLFNVNSNIAEFYQDVIVVDSAFSLKTDTLRFDTKNQIAYFEAPTRIAQDSTKIYCEGGYYKTDENIALLYDHAQYQKNLQRATADTIKYDGATKMTALIGKAIFEEETKKATADVIRFDGINDLAYLEGHAKYQSDKQKISGDSIKYDNKKQIFASRGKSQYNEGALFLDADQMDSFGDTSVASGHVLYRDTSEHMSIVSDVLAYQKSSEFFKAYGKRRPIFKSAVDNDTLYLSADTLLSKKTIKDKFLQDSTMLTTDSSTRNTVQVDSIQGLKPTDSTRIAAKIIKQDSLSKDTIRQLLAFNDVRIYKKDFQGRCDSLVYDSRDSMFQLYKSPILWTDTITQMTADTINIRLRNNQIHQLDLLSKGLIVSTKNEQSYDQIKGSTINAFFKDGKTDFLKVTKESESIYFIKDEAKAYVGPNQSTSEDMVIYFNKESVSKIKMIGKVTGKLSPMKKIIPKDLKVKGFEWRIETRILRLEDLF